jgi:hypothetical protein
MISFEPARPGPTPRESLNRGEVWWADCPRCRCGGRVDLQRLVDGGRGEVCPDTMRCPNCKNPDLSVRVRSAARHQG